MNNISTLDELLGQYKKSSQDLFYYISESLEIAIHKPTLEVSFYENIQESPLMGIKQSALAVFQEAILNQLKKEIKDIFQIEKFSFLMADENQVSEVFDILFEADSADTEIKDSSRFYSLFESAYLGPIFLQSSMTSKEIKDYEIYFLKKYGRLNKSSKLDSYYDFIKNNSLILSTIKIIRNNEKEEYNYLIKSNIIKNK